MYYYVDIGHGIINFSFSTFAKGFNTSIYLPSGSRRIRISPGLPIARKPSLRAINSISREARDPEFRAVSTPSDARHPDPCAHISIPESDADLARSPMDCM